MARRILLGRAGAGKTHACLAALQDALRAGRQALLLVPTYSQAEHLRYRILDQAGGLGARAVETFSSLAERVAGRRLSDLVPAPVRDRVAAGILDEFFPEARGQAGFRAEFLAVVKELKEQGDPVSATLKRARAHFEPGARSLRLFEAYARYVDALGGPDHEDLLLLTRDALLQRPLDVDLLLVDGFFDFTPVQRRILDRLADHAADALVTLPVNEEALRTAQSFAGFTTGYAETNHRASGALAHLEKTLFAPPEEPVPGDGAVQILACPSEEDEADRLARFVAASKRPFNDFLLIRRGFAGFHSLYRAAFARFDIPLRFYGPEPLGRTPAARAVIAWLRWRLGQVTLTEVLPMLRSPFLIDGPKREELDRLARTIRREGEPDALDRFGSVRAVLERGALIPFRVAEALVHNPRGDLELARASVFFRELRKEVAADPDPERLLRRIPLLSGTVKDRRHDCVYAVDASDARQWEQPVVMVAGLTCDSFPKQVRQDIFLRDDERRELAAGQGISLPLRGRREHEERYLFYVAVTRASEQLLLSYSAYDEEGTPRPPSPYVLEVQRHVSAEVREIPLAEQYVLPDDAVGTRDLLPIVADGIHRDNRLAVALHDLGAVDRRMLAWPRRLELLRTRPIEGLPEGTGRRLSASSINSYRRCPFLYLVRSVLRVQPARAHALDPLLRGNIVHDALERCAKEGGDCGAIFDELFAELAGNLRLGINGEYWRRWLRMVTVREAEAMATADVVEAEYQFEIDVGGVTLRGRIDRIDRLGGGVLVRDYKTGRADHQAALELEELQLDAYLLAVEHLNPVGAIYDRLKLDDVAGFALQGCGVEGKKIIQLTREEFDARGPRTRAIVRGVSEAIGEGRLAVGPRDPETCRRGRCDGFDLCRVARGRWLAKKARRQQP